MSTETDTPDSSPVDGSGESTVRLTVPEMDCPSCAPKVGKSLDRLDGVLDRQLQPPPSSIDASSLARPQDSHTTRTSTMTSNSSSSSTGTRNSAIG